MELLPFHQQVLHQRPILRITLEASLEQLSKGAQGGQGIAHLVHQQAQLLLLPLQLLTQALVLQIQQQGLSE